MTEGRRGEGGREETNEDRWRWGWGRDRVRQMEEEGGEGDISLLGSQMSGIETCFFFFLLLQDRDKKVDMSLVSVFSALLDSVVSKNQG